jgi:hypothetical protein
VRDTSVSEVAFWFSAIAAAYGKVLVALSRGDALRWCDMPDRIGHTTLRQMVEKDLIKQVENGAGPYSKHLCWHAVTKTSS